MASRIYSWLLGAGVGVGIMITVSTLPGATGKTLGTYGGIAFYFGLSLLVFGLVGAIGELIRWKRTAKLKNLIRLDTQGRIIAERALAATYTIAQMEVWHDFMEWRKEVLLHLPDEYALAFVNCWADNNPKGVEWEPKHLKAITGSSATLRMIIEHLRDRP